MLSPDFKEDKKQKDRMEKIWLDLYKKLEKNHEKEDATKKTTNCLCKIMRDYILFHGMLFRDSLDSMSAKTIPCTALPTPFPEKVFRFISQLQIPINKLIHRMSMDIDFIADSLSNVIKNDEFTSKLLALAQDVHANRFDQVAFSGILRTDYMLNDYDPSDPKVDFREQAKQIEINTVSVSYMRHSKTVKDLHNFIINKLNSMEVDGDGECLTLNQQLEPNNGIESIVDCLSDAYMHYVGSRSLFKKIQTSTQLPCILFVVQDNEMNSYDQLGISYMLNLKLMKLFKTMRPPAIFFKTIKELMEKDVVELATDGTGELILKEEGVDYAVAISYFRCFYTPDDFIGEETWQLRRRIELSRAIKIPNVSTQLVGAKKFQQVLTKPGVMERFLDREEASLVRKAFAQFYSFDNKEKIQSVIDMLKSNRDGFVMKPQREGGVKNYYGDEMISMIDSMDRDQLSQFIVMQIIRPKIYKNFYVNSDSSVFGLMESIAELGIWGTYLVDPLCKSDSFIINHTDGYLLRTKDVSHNDGGITVGRAVLDSPLFY